jgi:Kef-type K+ transport system membrane component KefB
MLLPALLSGAGNPWQTARLAILKAALFVVLMLFAGTRFLPWLLTCIAHTRSRELFILAVVALARSHTDRTEQGKESLRRLNVSIQAVHTTFA